jgi:hypothetical protein
MFGAVGRTRFVWRFTTTHKEQHDSLNRTHGQREHSDA